MVTTPQQVVSSPLAAIWPDTFERTYPVWGKEVVLRALSNAEVEQINAIAAQQPAENQYQALAILTVAASIVSVDGRTFTYPQTGQPLSLEQKSREVEGWSDVLTAALNTRYTELSVEYRAIIEGIVDPNASTAPDSSTAPSERQGGSEAVPSPIYASLS